MIVLFVKWLASDVFEIARGDMKLPFILVVAAFLLCSVIAERNGPKNNLTPWRRFNKSSGDDQKRHSSEGLIRNIRNESPNDARRRPSTFEVVGASRSPRTLERKFRRILERKNPFITSGGYAGSERSEPRAPRGFSTSKFRQARRSLDLGIKSNHLSARKINSDATFLEPIVHYKSKESILGGLFGTDFTPDSNDVLGPSIGPLNLPGIGKSVYIRLMVAPDEETASHITVHLVKKGPVETFGDVYETPVFAHPQKPKPLYPGKNSIPLALGRPRELMTSSPVDPRRSRFLNKPVRNLGFNPSEEAAFGLLREQNQRKIPHEMPDASPAQFGDPRQYSAAANHHELPVVLRPAENLIDLPIYPPLSAIEAKYEVGRVQNETNVSADAQMDTADVADDPEQSASSGHTFVSRDYSTSPTARQSIRVSVLPGPEVVSNRGESPEPVFMEEIKAPDLSAGVVSMAKESPWWKLKKAMVSKDAGEHGSVNLQPENSSSTAAAHEDKRVARTTLDYFSRHATTPKTNYVFS